MVTILASVCLRLAPAAIAASTTRASVSTNGTEGNSDSFAGCISADGRFVAFYSNAMNLVSGDTNGRSDVFVHDRQTGQTTRVSKATNGTQGNDHSLNPSISADGRFVAFTSFATNLVAGDSNASQDVFVRDRQTGQTTRVSKATDGMQGNGISNDASISGDGRFVAFTSRATNLVAGDTNSASDIFVRDRQTGQTTRVSKATDGAEGNFESSEASTSGDGRYVAFSSIATNLVAGDTNASQDIFVRDRETGQTTRVSKATDGSQGNSTSSEASVSADGQLVAFSSLATMLVGGDTNGKRDIFVRDRQTGQTTRVSKSSDGTQGSGESSASAISGDGRFVAFTSLSPLVNDDHNLSADVFVRDRQTGVTSLETRNSIGETGLSGGNQAAISGDGRFVVFTSGWDNFVADDNNNSADIFVRDRL